MTVINLGDIQTIAAQVGLDQEGQQVAMAIAVSEGYQSQTPTAETRNGEIIGYSYGPYQFFTGGKLGEFAQQVNLPLASAGTYAIDHPDVAVRWALSGYLGNAIQRGEQLGLHGGQLAAWVSQYGQVSAGYSRLPGIWTQLFGASGSGIPTADPGTNGTGSGGNSGVPGSNLPIVGGIIGSIGSIDIGGFAMQQLPDLLKYPQEFVLTVLNNFLAGIGNNVLAYIIAHMAAIILLIAAIMFTITGVYGLSKQVQ